MGSHVPLCTKRAPHWFPNAQLDGLSCCSSCPFLPAQPVPTLPVPSWALGKPVSLDAVNKVTDAYLKSLEPAKKLSAGDQEVRTAARQDQACLWGSGTRKGLADERGGVQLGRRLRRQARRSGGLPSDERHVVVSGLCCMRGCSCYGICDAAWPRRLRIAVQLR